MPICLSQNYDLTHAFTNSHEICNQRTGYKGGEAYMEGFFHFPLVSEYGGCFVGLVTVEGVVRGLVFTEL